MANCSPSCAGLAAKLVRPYRVTLLGRWSQLDMPAPVERARLAETAKRADAAFPAGVRDRYRGCGRRSSRRAHLRRARASLCRRQGRGLRYRCRWGLCQPAPLRDVARQRYLVGRRRRFDQWDSRRVAECCDCAISSGRARGRARPSSLAPGARLVLSERTEGEPAAVPPIVAASDRSRRDPHEAAERRFTDTGDADCSAAPPRRDIDHHRPHGVGRSHRRHSRRAHFHFGVGRSRNQALVIDWAHAEVSGRHFEIVALDESGAQVVVHGDNGVAVDGTSHGPGTEFKWKPGETLLARRQDAAQASPCTLTLSQVA